MPSFNSAPHLAEAIESVLNQTWSNLELIVVDDGSTDESAAVFERQDDSRLNVLQQPRQLGASAARNRAFRASRGEWVIFLDSDDWIPPAHLQALHAAASGSSLSIGMSQWDRFYKSRSEAHFPLRRTYRDAGGTEWLREDWSSGPGQAGPGMFLIPRALIEQSGGWDERLSLLDDFEFHARILSISDGVRYAPDARLYVRSGLAGSLSTQKGRAFAESACLSLLLGVAHVLAIDESPNMRLASANRLRRFDFDFYPAFRDLRAKIRQRVGELGGSNLRPEGPPGFELLRPIVGWRVARHAQLFAERWGFNHSARNVNHKTRANGSLMKASNQDWYS